MRSLSLNVGGVDLVAMIGERDGEDMVAAKPISEALGLDWKTQHRKISKDGRLRCGHMTIPSAGGPQEMLCIPIKKVASWLFSINPNKVREQYKEAVLAFQDELQHALYSYVKGDLTHEKMAELIARLDAVITENQLLRSELDKVSNRLSSLEQAQQYDEMATKSYASAGSYNMLARKSRKNLTIVRN